MSLVVIPIAVPLVGALLSLLLRRSLRPVSAVFAVATVASTLVLAQAVAAHGALHHPLGGWGVPLGINVRADGIAAVVLPLLGLAALLLTVQCVKEPPVPRELYPSFFALWFLAWAALNALILSADVFNLYVTLELTTLAGTALVALRGDRPALHAAARYLLIALVGALMYLVGVALLYGAAATLDLGLLGQRLTASGPTAIALSLMVGGMALKAGLVPLHGWVVPAYLRAPPSVTGLLSGVISKGPFFVLMRLWLDVIPGELKRESGIVLGALGAMAVVWASLLALRQRRLTALVIYSSLAQIGYMFLLFPLGSATAVAGSVYLAIAHAAAKGAMFLSVIVVHRTVGHDELDRLGPLVRQIPVTFFALALAGVTLIGMPPTGGFVAKWLLLVASIEEEKLWVAMVLVVGTLLTAAYVFRVLRLAFIGGNDDEPRARRWPELTEMLALALALVALALGSAPSLPVGLLLTPGGAP